MSPAARFPQTDAEENAESLRPGKKNMDISLHGQQKNTLQLTYTKF